MVHVHNDLCYDSKGNLTCTLEEHEPHEHTEECWVTEKVLVCGEEETAGTEPEGETPAESGTPESGEAAPEEGTPAGEEAVPESAETPSEETPATEPAEPELICGKEAHTHDENCYEDALACGYEEEHVHEEACLNQTLACENPEHTHSDECKDEEGNLTCGLEEHEHLVGCFDINGNVICHKEIHVHGDACKDGEGSLVCGLEEHPEHFAGCYTQEYVCGKAEHTHQEECHTQNLTCGLEEHEHTEDCYAQPAPQEEAAQPETPAESTAPAEAVPESAEAPEESKEAGTDAQQEEAAGHVHTDECYEEVTRLVCGELELHTHDDSCYAEDCFDEEGNLIEGSERSCGMIQLEEHVHTTDCMKTVELTPEEVAALENGAKLHIHTEECYDEEGNLICGHDATHIHMPECYDDTGKLLCGYGTATHVHEDSCYDAAGGLICGYKTATHVHEDNCYDAEGNLHCGYDTAVHAHEAGCYDAEGNLICGYETATHVHDSDCYNEEGALICGYDTASHAHTDSCYDKEGNLMCGYDTARHQHRDSCYDEEGNLTCGYEDTEEHKHDKNCYDEDGNLICGYEDAEEHEHDKNCYDEEGSLTCGHEDAIDHEHDEGCYDEEGNLICGYETKPHVHEDRCYDKDGNLICGHEDADESEHVRKHEHDENCYDKNGNLTCGYTDAIDHEHDAVCYGEDDSLVCGYEGVKDHEHDANCYDEKENLICGYKGVKDHEHYAACYGEDHSLICGYEGVRDHEHDAKCYDAKRNLVCGYKGVKNHEHDANCYDKDGKLICGYEGVKDHEHDAKCYDVLENLVCGYEGAEFHVHTSDCYDEDGHLACGYEIPEEYENTRTCEVGNYLVVVKYNDDANIPKEAEFRAEEITPDNNEAHYENREAEYQKAMEDKNATMKALLKIGFYLDGKEIEPQTPVTVTVQFLDEDGLAEGNPITVIHFAEDGIEKLDGSDAKDNSTTFQMESFSEIAIGYTLPEKSVRDGKLYISNDFEYDADPFHIIFHVEGEPKTLDGKPVIINLPPTDGKEDETGSEDSEGAEGEDITSDSETPEEEGTEPDESSSDSEVTEEGDSEEMEDTDGSDTTTNDKAEAEGSTDSDIQEVKLHIDFLDEDIELREALMSYIGESTEMINRNILHLIAYRLTYGETELDLSDCTVTVEIILGEATDAGEEEGTTENQPESGAVDQEQTAGVELDGFIVSDAEEGDEGPLTVTPQDSIVVSEGTEDTETSQTLKGVLNAEDTDTEISVMAIGITKDQQMSTLGQVTLNGENRQGQMDFPINSGVMALTGESTANPSFQVQYYAYVQVLEDGKSGVSNDISAIEIIDTSGDGFGTAVLPQNSSEPNRTKMYVKQVGSKNYENADTDTKTWGIYEPVYKARENSLTKIYLSDSYNFNDAPELQYINKFAKEGLHYGLCEVWVLKEGKEPQSENKEDWDIYSDWSSVKFTNNPANPDLKNGSTILITSNTVIRLVGESNAGSYNNDVNFFDYDFTDGGRTAPINIKRQGINSIDNYSSNSTKPLFGVGNYSSGDTGLVTEKLNGYYINRAQENVKSIIRKCSYGIAQSQLGEDGFPILNANAPNLFNPAVSQTGKTLVPGFSLDFDRNGDTYTLKSVKGSQVTNLHQFQGGAWAWYPGTPAPEIDKIYTNQFWPMDDSKDTYGQPGHDLKFGSRDHAYKTKTATNETKSLAKSDDGEDHNSFFGMNFAVKFRLTDDYVGPLNYYFFGDDDMWVYLVDGDTGDSQLICDIGGVHQAAGEYVNLWNYIQQPTETVNANGNRTDITGERGKLYYLKFFYTERGASGSTCWMQFTLPSVNAVPITNPSGDCKNTLTVSKEVDGADTDQAFEFTIEFTDETGVITNNNNYAYEIVDDKGENVADGNIATGQSFRLKNKQSIIIRNLPDGTNYTIREKDYAGYEPEVSGKGTIKEGQMTTGTIDWTRDDNVNYTNKEVEFNLPETGGSGRNLYTIAGGMVLLFGAGFLYKKKFGERRAQDSL